MIGLLDVCQLSLPSVLMIDEAAAGPLSGGPGERKWLVSTLKAPALWQEKIPVEGCEEQYSHSHTYF